MKKMNFNFLRLKTKMVLPLFLLVGLFLLSATSANAQYVSKREAKEAIDNYISQLPPRVATVRAVGHAMTPKMVEEETNSMRHRFGQSIMHQISNGAEVSEAIEKTYSLVKKRIDALGTTAMVEYLDKIKSEYVDLLSR